MEVHPPPSLAGASLDPEPRFTAHRRAFHGRYGAADEPTRVFFAPGRINLMGAHLDYNGGPVMPMAIDRGTFLALRPRTDGRLRLASSHWSATWRPTAAAAAAARPTTPTAPWPPATSRPWRTGSSPPPTR